MIKCGIDEAGRGPVIGPLVMCGVTIEEKDEIRLKNIGAKDSKLLTPKQREALFDKILGIVKDYKIEIIHPFQIDAALNDPDMNLNWLEAVNSIKIINELNPDKVIIDSPSNNVKAYKSYVQERLENKNMEILVEHKADVNHPVVSAASILAKVTRDKEVRKIHELVGENFGSGYPSDPVTQEFLKNNWNKYPDIFRKTWVSYDKYAKTKLQSRLDEFNEHTND